MQNEAEALESGPDCFLYGTAPIYECGHQSDGRRYSRRLGFIPESSR